MEKQVMPYEYAEEVGQGGMGVVNKYRHKFLDRYVAIKEMKGENMNDEEFIRRFDREAQSAGRLHHQNIVAIYDYWKTPNKCSIVMEFIDGTNLRKVLSTNRRLPVELSAYVGLELARGLGYAHRHKFIHRDVKPSNILLSREGEVKIVDFGIVRDEVAKTDLTRSGAQIGTTHYMSPEQLKGEKADGRSDIFSLGLVLYEVLTTVHPFGARETPGEAVGARILSSGFAKVRQQEPRVPVRLARIVEKCLRKKLSAQPSLWWPPSWFVRPRYADMASLERALASFLWRYDLAYAPQVLAQFLGSTDALTRTDPNAPPRAMTPLPPAEPLPGSVLPESRLRRILRRALIGASVATGAAAVFALYLYLHYRHGGGR